MVRHDRTDGCGRPRSTRRWRSDGRRDGCHIIVAALVGWWACQAQPASSEPPTVGLVLSGGSAKGFAHVGVLRVLEQAGIPIDVVVGTSMGALVGGLYAIGYGPDELEQIATEQDWDHLLGRARTGKVENDLGTRPSTTLMSFPLEGRQLQLPTSLVAGQPIWRLLARLGWRALPVHDFRQFPIPFAAVATDLDTGEAQLLDHGSLPTALRASMSLPGIFAPVVIDGRVLVDGGVARNLPSTEARLLGADLLICSDVSEPLADARELRSFFDVVMQTLSFRMTASTDEQRQLCDVLITPDLDGLSGTAFDEAGAWIRRGEAAAQRQAAVLQPLARGSAADSDTAGRRRLVEATALPIDVVAIRGTDEAGAAFVRSAVELDVPGRVTATALEAALGRVERTGVFERIIYHLEGSETGTTLVFEVANPVRDQVGLGFRYDNRYKAALLFDLGLSNRGGYRSRTHVALRLGEQLELRGRHVRSLGTSGRFFVGVDASYQDTPIDVFDEGQRVAEVAIQVANGSGFFGSRLGEGTTAHVRLTGEHARGRTAVSAIAAGESLTYFTFAGSVEHNSFDRPVFPRRGARLRWHAEGAHREIGSGGTFWQHLVDLQAAVPATSRLSILFRAIAGAAGGPDLPFHYQYFLGGASPSAVFTERQPVFPGLRGQERAGRAVQMVQLGAQYEFGNRLVLAVRGHAGNTADEWTVPFDRYLGGYEVSFGAPTFIGPMEVALGGRGLGDRTHLEVRIGHAF